MFLFETLNVFKKGRIFLGENGQRNN